MALRSLAQNIKLLYLDDRSVTNPRWTVHALAMAVGLAIAMLAGCTPEINDAIAYRIAHPGVVDDAWVMQYAQPQPMMFPGPTVCLGLSPVMGVCQ